ncbi:DUF3526 domain-containing protein [Parasphingorhabdus cellanae]|uniref:DUF3526 domain-containing protein n=1 Tax=Parasphingorhabdus cellanae TaxID=2806553 RepID=A0ABX7TA06_9SPHN|nr:DUF3526 domain-containing protein [Parasphingorhabdus cellanae]QTD57177.1 DUF3526 domain-containing protein [Parasphingorhabdus cellanae]
MITYLTRLELLTFLRGRAAIATLLIVLILVTLATILGAQRVQEFEAERAAASVADRQIWLDQGADNPHAAAHFSRYAFKPIPALSLFDPGTLDTAGIAIWMEGHYQNPSQFRRAEDAPSGLQAAQLSPAWVLILFGSLLLIIALHGSVAGERETGTLRQVLASGLDPRRFAAGKLFGALFYTVGLLGLTMLIVLFAIATLDLPTESDLTQRILLLLLAYGLFFIAIAGMAVGISALCRTSRGALGILVGLWAAVIIAGPYLAAQFALTVHEDVDGPTTYQRIVDASNSYFQDDAAREETLQKALTRYGVDEKANLPIRYDGYELQHSEEIAHPKFEAIYGEVEKIHEDQENVLTASSTLMPGLLITRLSAALSGTDLPHHRRFAVAAEKHRRTIVKMLNDDLTYSEHQGDDPYLADQTLWKQIPDFKMELPRLAETRSQVGLFFIILAAQAFFAVLFARWAILHATRQVSR